MTRLTLAALALVSLAGAATGLRAADVKPISYDEQIARLSHIATYGRPAPSAETEAFRNWSRNYGR